MDTIFIIIGIIGIAIIATAVYIFSVAARNYVTDESHDSPDSTQHPEKKEFILRNPAPRRSDHSARFPLAVNGILVTKDRRQLTDRRSLPGK